MDYNPSLQHKIRDGCNPHYLDNAIDQLRKSFVNHTRNNAARDYDIRHISEFMVKTLVHKYDH